MQAKPKTVGGLVVTTLGLRKGWRVIRLVTTWAFCVEALGHDPTMAEYVEFCSESQATAYRDLELFRQVFGDGDPSRLIGRARDRIVKEGDEGSAAAVVMGLPVR